MIAMFVGPQSTYTRKINTQHTDPRYYSDVIMSAMASQITAVSIIYSTAWSGVDQRKHQSSVSLAFVRGIHRWPVDSPHKGPVTQKMFPFDDIIMITVYLISIRHFRVGSIPNRHRSEGLRYLGCLTLFMSTTATFAPSSAYRFARDFPIPAPAPVTSTTRPWMSLGLVGLTHCQSQRITYHAILLRRIGNSIRATSNMCVMVPDQCSANKVQKSFFPISFDSRIFYQRL